MFRRLLLGSLFAVALSAQLPTEIKITVPGSPVTCVGADCSLPPGSNLAIGATLPVGAMAGSVALAGQVYSGGRLIPTRPLTSNSWYPHIVTLVGGQDDEVPLCVNCTAVGDTTNYKVGTRGWQMQMASAVTGQLRLSPPGPDNPTVFGTGSALGMWLYLDDASKVISTEVEMYSNGALSTSASRSWTGLSSGWNYLRVAATDMTLTNWGSIYMLRVMVTTNAATNATVGHVWIEQQAKAQLLFVEDGGYTTFLTGGYPDLKAIGVPVTWAICPGWLGEAGWLTEPQVAKLAAENRNRISFHSWETTPTSAMTAGEIRADTMRSLKWLQSRGYDSVARWRPAWTQNLATNADAARGLVMAYATPTEGTSLTVWPPIDKWNIPRYGIHGRTEAELDVIFGKLQSTHGMLVAYTHGVGNGDPSNITPAMWAYFIAKVRAGIEAGWLDGVTFEDLAERTAASAPAQMPFNIFSTAGLP